MAGFLAEIKQNVENCDVFYLDSLSYSQHFMVPTKNPDKNANKLILICKLNQGLTNTDTYNSPPKNRRKRNSILNLTGSPLQDSFQYDTLDDSITIENVVNNLWSDNEANYHPIEASIARAQLNNIISKTQCKSSPTCWVICEGGANEDDSNELMMSLSLRSGRMQRGILKFNNFVQFEEIDIMALQAKHNLYTPKNAIVQSSTVDTFYNVCLSNERIMKLQITYQMNGPIAQSEMHKNKSSLKVTLHQSIRINNLGSTAWKLWHQIDQLHTIKENIQAYKEYDDTQYLKLNITCDSDFGELKEEILEIMGGYSDYQYFDTENDDTNNKGTSIELNVLKICDRECTIMTDQLWNVLKRCSSYDMLVDAFHCIFKLAVGINIVHMPKSNNKLSELIREISDQRLAIPRLVGSEPLELLLEIGLEKLRKDYELIFTESKLCSAEELRVKSEDEENEQKSLNVRKSLRGPTNQPVAASVSSSTARKTLMQRKTEYNTNRNDNFGIQNSVFDLNVVECELTQLAYIHLTLEHLMSIENKMNISNGYPNFLEDLRKPKIPFDQVKEMDWDKRIIEMNNSKILQQIQNNNEMPTQYRIYFQSQSKFKRIYNTFLFSLEPVFPPNLFQCIPAANTANNTLDTLKEYYAFQYSDIESL